MLDSPPAEASVAAPEPPSPQGRSDFVDALRGFALVGICVVNLTIHGQPVLDPRAPSSAMDVAAQALVALLFEGKFFLLFSLLFGFGFARQLEAVAAGRSTPAAYARRLIGLFSFGLAHGVLLFPGDILMVYALLGALLWRCRAWPDARLLARARTVVLFLAVPLLLLAGLSLDVAEDPLAVAREAERATAAYRGTFAQALGQRLIDLAFGVPTALLFNGPLAFAAFCVGLVLGRRGLVDDPERLAKLVRPRLRALALAALVGNGLYIAAPHLPVPLGAPAFVGLAFGGPALAALYTYGLALLWMRGGQGQALVARLAPGGRLSLTNYLGQSVAANVLFMGWGLGLYGALGRAELLGSALVIALGLIGLSGLWLRAFRTGVAEWLLRSWTGLRWQPFRRRATLASNG